MLPRVKADDVALVITSAGRIKALPEMPTSMELGLADREMNAWYAYVAPKGAPQEILDVLAAEPNKILISTKTRQRLEDASGIVRPVSPSELRQFVREEHER